MKLKKISMPPHVVLAPDLSGSLSRSKLRRKYPQPEDDQRKNENFKKTTRHFLLHPQLTFTRGLTSTRQRCNSERASDVLQEERDDKSSLGALRTVIRINFSSLRPVKTYDLRWKGVVGEASSRILSSGSDGGGRERVG
mmetsp:Transcript_4474/g.8903  ORF Transcript_4474/g.8903 Transcript_4474/m.8903 type:complete len:139 (+) Transcript_4474:1022-1438(+)